MLSKLHQLPWNAAFREERVERFRPPASDRRALAGPPLCIGARTAGAARRFRRDIDKIDEAGEARKVYGGISALDGAAYAGVAYARPYDENRDLAVDAKR